MFWTTNKLANCSGRISVHNAFKAIFFNQITLEPNLRINTHIYIYTNQTRNKTEIDDHAHKSQLIQRPPINYLLRLKG